MNWTAPSALGSLVALQEVARFRPAGVWLSLGPGDVVDREQRPGEASQSLLDVGDVPGLPSCGPGGVLRDGLGDRVDEMHVRPKQLLRRARDRIERVLLRRGRGGLSFSIVASSE